MQDSFNLIKSNARAAYYYYILTQSRCSISYRYSRRCCCNRAI